MSIVIYRFLNNPATSYVDLRSLLRSTLNLRNACLSDYPTIIVGYEFSFVYKITIFAQLTVRSSSWSVACKESDGVILLLLGERGIFGNRANSKSKGTPKCKAKEQRGGGGGRKRHERSEKACDEKRRKG